MKRFVFACICMSALLGLSFLTLADAAIASGSFTLSVTVAPRTTPVPQQAPEPGATADPFTATLTPEATFVPLPTSTPLADGSTPAPGPATCSPYPSPEKTAEPLPASALMGTVTEREVTLRALPSEAGSRRGTLRLGDTVRVMESSAGWHRIESGSVGGWVPETALRTEEVSLGEAAHTVIRVSSLNIHSCRRGDDIRALADALVMADVDVVGLQEVIRTDKADWLQRLAEEGEFPYYYFSRTVRRKDGEYGIALMSRFPIVFAETLPLDGYEGDEPRTLQHVALLTGEGVVHVFNTHLSAQEMYKKSVNLASLIFHVRASGLETLAMTGDFNCGPPRLSEFWPEVRFSNMTVNTYGDGSVPKILDNVLYTGRIRVVRTEYKPLRAVTDHSLVTAELIYEQKAEQEAE